MAEKSKILEFPVWGFLVFFVPKLYLCVNKMCKSFVRFRFLVWICTDLYRFDDSSKSVWSINSIVKGAWTSWTGFGPVEWSGWGLVVIPFGKWSSGKKSYIFDGYCPRNLYWQFLHCKRWTSTRPTNSCDIQCFKIINHGSCKITALDHASRNGCREGRSSWGPRPSNFGRKLYSGF